MVAGGVLAWLVMAAGDSFFGDSLQTAAGPGKNLISQMSDDKIRDAYMLYIGAGAVAAGGIFSLSQALPLILGSLRAAFASCRSAGAPASCRSTIGSPHRSRHAKLARRRRRLGMVLAIWATIRCTVTWLPGFPICK